MSLDSFFLGLNLLNLFISVVLADISAGMGKWRYAAGFGVSALVAVGLIAFFASRLP